MSERYNPKKLIRERVASGEPPTTDAAAAVDYHQKYLRELSIKRLGGFPIQCTHGVAWTECATCSRPVRK